VLAPQPLVRAITAVHQYNVTCAPSISQYLALEVFRKPEWLAHNRPIYCRRRQVMVDALRRELDLPTPSPEGALYVFPDVSRFGASSLALAQALLEEVDVITVPGVAFGASGEGFLRLSYAVGEEQINEGIARVASHLRRYAGLAISGRS
jgi:aminotransferase